MGALVQPDIGALLETAGARPRGNRHDCPKCGGLRTVTRTPECFYCHKCQWRGNVITLQKELGAYRRIPSAEYRGQRRTREQAHDAALRLYARAKTRRLELYDELRTLNRIETGAHHAGPTEVAWTGLALVYRERPGLLAELTILENATARDLARFLTADDATRQGVIDRVIERGGMFDSTGKFVEACP